ncbi:N-acetyltransferase [Sphingosinicella sp. BN140058]|nr:N-acetyltransferase [Sphingosinicella sp. BN140058]
MPKLIPFAIEHFEILSSWFDCEADLVRWGGPSLRFPLAADQLQAMIDEGEGPRPERLCWMAAFGDTMVGHAQLVFDWRNDSARLARVAIAPQTRGQGLAAPMLRIVVARAFSFPELQRLELNVYANNVPAIRAYRRLGFVAEGTRRASTRVGNERWDTALMAMLRPEWERAGPQLCDGAPTGSGA